MLGAASGPFRSREADGVSVSRMKMKKKTSHKHKHKHHAALNKTIIPPVQNIIGCRIMHKWKEDCSSPISFWTGKVLDQIPVNPSLYLIKYDGFDCVYGLEIFRDERVQGLEILPDRIAPYRINDARLAERMLGRAVEHQFETEDGSKNGWKGLVLARAPIMPTWFFITYEKDPVLYMYQLLEDYKEGDLQILPDTDTCHPNKGVHTDPGVAGGLVSSAKTKEEPTEAGEESLVGRQVEYENENGTKRTGTIIHQVQAKPSVYFIKFDYDYHIYVYDMV